MTVAALLDLGVEFEDLQKILDKLPVEGYRLSLKRVTSYGNSGLKFNVKIDESQHEHRNLSDVTKIIEDSEFNEKVKKLALEIYSHIAKAEAKVHKATICKVHFHEVGAIDSIIDILSVAYCIDQLKIDEIYSTPISCGTGFVNCAHGRIVVPVPATREIIKNLLVNYTNIQGELTTPTGAAILKTIVDQFQKPSNLEELKTGYGIGSKDYGIPNLLKVSLVDINM
jgi:uncharacterized protein (TIGR00299 family) protein